LYKYFSDISIFYSKNAAFVYASAAQFKESDFSLYNAYFKYESNAIYSFPDSLNNFAAYSKYKDAPK
jgi:hypothetical protein